MRGRKNKEMGKKRRGDEEERVKSTRKMAEDEEELEEGRKLRGY